MAELDAVIVAGGSASALGYVEEVSYGKVPVSPTLKLVRRTSTSLGRTTEMYRSAEVRPDRQSLGSRHGVRRSGGDLAIEISPESHKDFYEALLGDYWQTPAPVSLATVNMTATLNATTELLEITATDFDYVAAQMYVGAPVTFTGANAALNGKLFTVVSHAANKVVLLPPVGFTLASPAALTAGTFHIKGARIGMGSIQRSFTFERAYSDIGRFEVFTGQQVSAFSAELPPTGIATGTFTLMGKDSLPMTNSSIDGVAEVTLDQTDLTSLTFDGVAGTITAGSGSWLAEGFEPGDRVQFSGTGITDVQNRQQRTVIAVTASVLTVAEAIQTGGPYTTFEVLKVGVPAYTEVSDEDILVAVSGVLLVNGEPAGTITGMSFSVDNQMGGSEVVGSNVIPFNNFGNTCLVTLNPTVLFGRGGAGEAMYNAALNEEAVSVVLRLDKRDGTGGLSFVFNRTLFSPGAIGDAEATGLPISMEGAADRPLVDNPELGTSQIYIYDTEVAGVLPAPDDLTLTLVSQEDGIATFDVQGGVAPYSFVFDTGETPIVIGAPGEFEHDYVTNGTYDAAISDAGTPTDTDTLAVVINSAA